jgi:pSer/pThr/pTyr-binding forkhead associated (FHA) protein
MVRCVVYHNDEPIKTYEIDDEIITIGRLPENTISIANMGISRRHARIERFADGSYVVTDLNSLNGTFVNNKKAKKATVASGDNISIGKFMVTFQVFENDEYAEAAAQQAIPADEPPPADETPPPARQSSVSDTKSTPRADLAPQTTEHTGAVLIETNKHVVHRIDKPVLTIGTSEEDDIFVSGFLIGDGHVVIERKEDGVWIGGQKLMGRFKVNGKKVSSHRLEHKDRIEIGNSTFRFMENG